jgi:hypothetical protein
VQVRTPHRRPSIGRGGSARSALSRRGSCCRGAATQVSWTRYTELDKRGAGLLFQVLTKREEKASAAIASDESFSGWMKMFTDPRLCGAIVDRLTFGGNIIETSTDSYRLAASRAVRANR